MPIFSNKEEDFFKNVAKLPEVLVDIVYEYVHLSTKLFMTKQLYIENHHIVKSLIDKRQYENYIRCMVRQDNFFVFSFLINENIIIWIRIRNYLYKDQVYENYIFFLHEYCIENESTRCKELIDKVIKILRFNKNKHKKKMPNNSRWNH
jgi:hypothetical protein